MLTTEVVKPAGAWKSLLLLLVGLGISSALPAAEGVQENWAAHFALPPGGRVAVENIHGNLRVEGWDRAEVDVVVTKKARAPTGRLAEVRIGVEFGRQSLTFRTLYPGDLEEPVQVDYHLRVPRQVRLEGLRTLQGDITVRAVDGSIDARSLSGNILEENVSGRMVAHALTGNIVASLHSLPAPGAALALDTVNGDVDLVLPPHPNADVEVNTVAGEVLSNYVFATNAALGDTTRRVRLGRGGVKVSLQTVRGNIHVGERSNQL